MATAMKQENESRTAPAAVEDAPKSGKKKFVLPIVGVLVLIALFWAFKTWSYGRTHESTDNAAVDGHLVPVLAKASGYVQRVTVADNDQVKVDSLLVQIDPAEYKVKLAQAEADIAAARASAGGAGTNGQAQAAVEQATGQRSSLDAQIAAARANETKARQDLARMQELADKQVVSRMQLDAARAASRKRRRRTSWRCSVRRARRAARSRARKRAFASPTRNCWRHRLLAITRRFS